MGRQIRIFIGSSSEAEKYDLQIQEIMESFGASVVHWRDSFMPGDNALDSLIKISTRVDCALLLITPDDKTFFRETAKISPRDNILFELGMFISALGKYSAGIVYVIPRSDEPAALPTDLHGVNFIAYDEKKPDLNKEKLKKWYDFIALRAGESQDEINVISNKLTNIILPLPVENRDIVTKQVNITLGSISRGEIKLEPRRYYNLLYEEMNKSGTNTEVDAIALISPVVWFEGAQTKYIEKNIGAAKRDATIKRLFIIEKNPPLELSDIIIQQLDAGIQIRYLRQGTISIKEDPNDLGDMVLFINKETNVLRAYLAESEHSDPTIITSSKLIFDHDACLRRKIIFDDLWHLATDISPRNQSVNEMALRSLIGNFPSDWLIGFNKLDYEVVSCAAAANARKVPLSNELKTLVLETDLGLVAVHTPGDKKVSLRKVKNKLQCQQARLASLTKLRELDVMPGTVSPFLPKLWDLKQLVSKSILNLKYLTTNSGTLTDYITFSPRLLLIANDYVLDDFDT